MVTIIYRGLFDQPGVSELSLIESQAGDTSNKWYWKLASYTTILWKSGEDRFSRWNLIKHLGCIKVNKAHDPYVFC